MSRRILSILLVILLLPFVPLEAKATEYTDQGFAYEVIDGKAKVIYNDNSNYGAHITIPETLGGYPVTTIGDGAFWYRTEVNTVTLPASVKKLEDSAFFKAGIYDINIENVEYFGSGSLGNVYMTELNFPEGAYIDCPVSEAPDLEKITIGDNSVVTDYTFADKLYTDQYAEYIVVFPKVKDIVIGNNVTIGIRSFSYLDALKRVVIGDGTSIGGSCFSSVPVLDTVVLGNVTAIGDGAFGFARSIKEITIPGSVAEIGDGAFQYGLELEKLVIEEGVTSVGEDAFRGCNALTEMYLPKSLTYVSRFSLGIPVSCFVFYGGRKADWLAIKDKDTDELWGRELENILYNYYPIDPTYVPRYVNEITIMGKGTAYGRFFLKHINNTIAKNRTVDYSINGTPQGTLVTDEDGYVVVSIGGITESSQYVIEFSGTGIQTTQGVLNVEVVPITFTSLYEAVITYGGNVGLIGGTGTSTDAAVAKMEAEAKIAEVGISGSLDTGFSLEQEYADGKNKLTLSTKRDISVGAEVELGLFAGVDISSAAGVEGSMGSVSGGGKAGWSYGIGYQDDDFNPKDAEDMENAARFIGAALLEGLSNNLVALYIADKINPPVNIIEKGSTVSLNAGASVGVFETNVDETTVCEAEIAGGSGKIVSTNSTTTLPDGSIKYNSSATTATGVQFASFKFKAKEDDASLAAGLNIWNNVAKNKVAFSAKVGSKGTLGEVSMSAVTSEDDSLFWFKDITNHKHTISYQDSSARAVVADYTPLLNFTSGAKGHFSKLETEKCANTMIYSGEIGKYTVSKEKQRGVNIGLSFGIKHLAVLGGEFGVSGIQSYEFEEYNGIYEKNAAFIQAHNDIEDEVADKFVTASEAIAMAYEKISEVIAEHWDEACEWVDENVIETAKAKVKKTKENATDWFVSITSPEKAKTYSLRSVSNGVSLASYEEEGATTIGAPCVVTVTDKDEKLVSDLSENPLELTLKYDKAEVDDLNLWNPNLQVLFWDTERGGYVNMPATIDAENGEATLNITKSGQYVLAIDDAAPEIIEFVGVMKDGKPYYEAQIKDFSGIDRVILRANGTEFVNADNFMEYYDVTTSKFSYPIYKHLEPGEGMYAQLIAYDSFNNEGWDEAGVDWEEFSIEEMTITPLGAYYSGQPKIELLLNDAEWKCDKAYMVIESTDIYGNVCVESFPATEEAIDYRETGLSYDYRMFTKTMPKLSYGSKVKLWFELYDYNGNGFKTPIQESVVLDDVSGPVAYISKIDGEKVSVTTVGGEEATDVFIGVYNASGRLVKVDRADFCNTVTFENIPSGMKIKAFLWNNQIPLCQTATVKTPDNLY